MPAYRCEYIPEVDLLVVVLVAARSSDFDQPHPRNGPPPLQQQEELQKHQQWHRNFAQGQWERAMLVPLDLEGGVGDVVVVVVEVRHVQPVVVGEDALVIQ